MKFEKPAKTISEQVELLREQGLSIPDQDKAAHYLTHLNYYRLSGYWISFEESRALRPGTNFDDVLNLYVFDRALRLLILDAIERIEVSVRTLSYLRNLCAHHSRIWNRKLTLITSLPT